MAEPGFNMEMLPSLQHRQAAVTVGYSGEEPKRRAPLTFLSLGIHFIYGGGTWTQNGNATISADGSGSYGTYGRVTTHSHYTSAAALPTATTPFFLPGVYIDGGLYGGGTWTQMGPVSVSATSGSTGT
jgi:hypothetical protein